MTLPHKRIRCGPADAVIHWRERVGHIAFDVPAPTNTVAPHITGSTAVGSTLTATPGTWTGTGPFSYTYQWRRNGVPIPEAPNQNTYVTMGADLDDAIDVRVYAVGPGPAASAVSNAITVTETAELSAAFNQGQNSMYAPLISGF